ncbi:MAG: hypothetical protein HYV36_03085 [Lentisphaerae bacterium]|nr:hypothetical protein [Lentisphaerota bacterium]
MIGPNATELRHLTSNLTTYYSVENLEACRAEDVNAYLPDREFRKRDPRFAEAMRHRSSADKRKSRKMQ